MNQTTEMASNASHTSSSNNSVTTETNDRTRAIVTRPVWTREAISLDDFVDNFTGRVGHVGYDASKQYKIAEINRGYVWKMELQRGLVENVLLGVPIPEFFLCTAGILDGGQRATTFHRFKNNQFSVKLNDQEMRFSDVQNDPVLLRNWLKHTISILTLHGETPEFRRKVFNDFNKGVGLSLGQILYSYSDKPIVSLALSMINRNKGKEFPLHAILRRVTGDKKWGNTKTLNELVDAYKILAGSLLGPKHFSTDKMLAIEAVVETTDRIIEDRMVNLANILHVFDEADPDNAIARKFKGDVFTTFFGAAIYDYHSTSLSTFSAKWTRFVRLAYASNKSTLGKLTDVGKDRADIQRRIGALSRNVNGFLEENLHVA